MTRDDGYDSDDEGARADGGDWVGDLLQGSRGCLHFFVERRTLEGVPHGEGSCPGSTKAESATGGRPRAVGRIHGGGRQDVQKRKLSAGMHKRGHDGEDCGEPDLQLPVAQEDARLHKEH